MRAALAGVMLCLPHSAYAGAEAELAACIKATDHAFDASRPDPVADRWASLPRLASADSACIVQVLTACTLRHGAGGCLDESLGYLERQWQEAQRRFPLDEDIPPKVLANFEGWRSRVTGTLAETGARLCAGLPADDPDACRALALGETLIGARDWLRAFDLAEDAQ
jgi:hypothetical protein